ncbi:MAG: 2-isopropylmalate synthase [Pseudomonadales bacterium]|nr:2-isopropylmalate synthase [Pseudomonadales bacterium]
MHVYNSTSTLQREKVFKKTVEQIQAIAVQGASWVKTYSEQYPNTQWRFEYSPESFSQTELPVAVQICNAVIQVFNPTKQQKCIINLPATVECTTPNIFADQIEWMIRNIDKRDCVEISVHTHNDRGCSVASAEMALLAGADRVEGTLLGNGERTGNMDIYTMAMNLYSQGIDPEIDISDASRIIKTVESVTNIKTDPRHQWLGELVFTAFSGSHQDAISKSFDYNEVNKVDNWEVAYLPIDPKDIGREYQQIIRINSQSGKGGIQFILRQQFRLQIPRMMQIDFSQKVQKITEMDQSEVDSQKIYNAFIQSYSQNTNPLSIGKINYSSDQTASKLIVEINNVSGEQYSFQMNKSGPIHAFIEGLNEKLGIKIDVVDYSEHAVGEHSNAKAASYMQCKINNKTFFGFSQYVDTLKSVLQSVMQCINQYLRVSMNQ